MQKLQMLDGVPILPDDPIEKVKASLDLTGEITFNVPANQLAFVVHALLVGLSHQQFDYATNLEPVELLAQQWANALGKKIPGLRPLFDSDWEAIELSRKARRSEHMPPLPSDLPGLKALAKSLGIKHYFAMDLVEILGEIEKFDPQIISEHLENGKAE
jgi:hypothetical protein